MEDVFSFSHLQDDERHRLYLTASGPMDSAAFIDRQIAALKATNAPWLYDRLIDLSECIGHVQYDDIVRLSQYWDSVAFAAKRPVHVAVVTPNRFIVARLPMADLLFKNHVMQNFGTLAEAEAWLDTRP